MRSDPSALVPAMHGDAPFRCSLSRSIVSVWFSEHAHALNWAIVDVTGKQYYADPILDRATPEILRKQLADGTYDLDQRMTRAFMEVRSTH
jgi:hypothetical protein